MKADATVLVATDLGPTGAGVVDHAAQLAEALGARLLLISVCDRGHDETAWAGATGIAPAVEAMRARLRARIERKAALLEDERLRCEAHGLDCEAELLEGRPWEAICEHAVRREATLVVVGARASEEGRPLGGELRDRLLGSTTDRVVRYAPCPVLVVGTRRPPRADLRGARWLVGVDLSEPSIHALRFARAAVARAGGELLLMSVVPPVGLDEEAGATWTRALDAHLRENAAESLAELIADPPADTHVEQVERVALGSPGDELCRAVDELGADVLVVGTHGRGGLRRLVLGSTAERCLARATVPVLVVRPPEGAA